MILRASTSNFSLQQTSEEAFWARVDLAIGEAKKKPGSDVLLFPEYMSLTWILSLEKGRDFRSALEDDNAFQKFKIEMRDRAKKSGMVIIAGSAPFFSGGNVYNQSLILFPDGKTLYQNKVMMTRFEKEVWDVKSGGPTLQIFDIKGVKCAVLICYDSEFPVLSAALSKEGVEVIFVPSCTDDIHGYWRVRHCSEARCIENQAYAVMASIVGGDPTRPEIETHHGQAGIFTPCDVGFKQMGLAALAAPNEEGVVTADLDIDLLRNIRKNGTVLNHADNKTNLQVQIQRG